eukprot:TRINITY_DN14421_c0_g1_i1.p1 TRINITY_DN14421_c0_g1~~TRINITY_DN14421_c0_g1_i1.p1  ORF type:complete len:272 (-),score=42.20 TRINITY_DN14421_c0_g1_i1:188-1003(-)
MSLAQSYGSKGSEGWTKPHIRTSEQRPRALMRPDYHFDEDTREKFNITRESSFSRSHGNAKCQEPPFMELRRSETRKAPRFAGHKHASKPWSSTSQPGKIENAHTSNKMHRAWLIDCGTQGRWTKKRKEEFYTKQDSDLFSLQPADEKFAVGANVKMWAHLLNGGTKRGGMEKLDYTPKRQTGLHLKHGIYIGKYENVQHDRVMNCTAKTLEGKKRDWEIDERPMFDNRLKDDNILHNHLELKTAKQQSFDIFRPKNTYSCPQLGVDFMHR